VIAELAAANAAFAVIKHAVANAGDIMAAGQKLFDYFDAKAAIQRKVNERAQGKGSTEGSSDWEEFQALEQLKAQEEHLRESMIYAGRPGLWDDWLKFQAEAARRRKAAIEAEIKRKKALRDRIEQAFWWGALVVTLSCAAAFFVVMYSMFNGRG